MKKQINLLPDRKEYCLLIKAAFTTDFCDQIVAQKKDSFKKAIGYIWTATVWNERLLTSGRDKEIKILV